MSSILDRIRLFSQQYDTEVVDLHVALKANWVHSNKSLESLSNQLKTSPIAQEPQLDCIAVAGSYARKEASAASDLDCIVVVKADTPLEEQKALHARVQAFLLECGY